MTDLDLSPPPGDKITLTEGKLEVPAVPIIPFIRGDGTGPDIWVAKRESWAKVTRCDKVLSFVSGGGRLPPLWFAGVSAPRACVCSR